MPNHCCFLLGAVPLHATPSTPQTVVTKNLGLRSRQQVGWVVGARVPRVQGAKA